MKDNENTQDVNGSGSSASYTPGPWIIASTSKRDFGTVTHIGPEDQPSGICEVYGSTDEPRSNARLIAAAPEMEAVLREALKWLELHADEGTNKLWGRLTAVLREIEGA